MILMMSLFHIVIFSSWTVLVCFGQPVPYDVNVMTVTLSVYSGTRDPVFQIRSYNSDFSSILGHIKYRGSTPLSNDLGYSGFTVTIFPKERTQAVRTVTVGRCTNISLETLLLHAVSRISDTNGHKLPDNVIQYVTGTIKACI